MTTARAGRFRAVHVDCAGLIVGFPSADRAWSRALRRRFAGFLTDEPPEFTVTRGLRVREGAALGAGAFGAICDRSARTADLPRDVTVLQAIGFLRTLLPGLIEDGLVAHAAVLLDGERGFLCCGRSGTGKSTLARLAGARGASDELGAVRRVGGAWTVWPLPFWRGRAGSARLEGVLLLRHARANERRRLTPAAALPALAGHLLWPVDTPEALPQRLDLLADLVARVPVWDLGFLPTPAVWATIAAASGECTVP